MTAVDELPWVEPLRRAEVELLPGMTLMDGDIVWYIHPGEYTPRNQINDRSASLPDLRDRATFLLCVDELAYRTGERTGDVLNWLGDTPGHTSLVDLASRLEGALGG